MGSMEARTGRTFFSAGDSLNDSVEWIAEGLNVAILLLHCSTSCVEVMFPSATLQHTDQTSASLSKEEQACCQHANQLLNFSIQVICDQFKLADVCKLCPTLLRVLLIWLSAVASNASYLYK